MPLLASRPVEDDLDDALAGVLASLAAQDYRFVTPSVATHRRNLGRRPGALAADLRDVFGWSLPFVRDLLSPDLLDLLAAADLLAKDGEQLRSRARVSSLGRDLFLHSAFPPNAPDAVFFGPDSYRFANFLRDELRDAEGIRTILDLGAGSGVGGVAARRLVGPAELILADINPRALQLSRANLKQAGLAASVVLSNGFSGVEGRFDLIVSDPPFIAGSGERTYRDGGDMYGARLSFDWMVGAGKRLNPGGRMLLYTGSAIVGGKDPFYEALEAEFRGSDLTLTYRELDPDIFGGQLSSPAYEAVERIAAVGVTLRRGDGGEL